jgi:hypothetical protein
VNSRTGYHRIWLTCEKAKQASKRRRRYRDLEEYIKSRTAAFSLCDNVEEVRSHRLAQSKEAFEVGNVPHKTFKFHQDQREIVEAALKFAKEKSGTGYDTVALEYISQQFMGTASRTSRLHSWLNARKHPVSTNLWKTSLR